MEKYEESFYNSQIAGSLRSAKLMSKHFSSIYTPSSVADIGCGRGAWLKAFGDNGANELIGIDGI